MRLLPLFFLGATLLPCQAQGPWDLQYTLTGRHQEVEVAWLPLFVEAIPQNVFANLKASVGLVQPHKSYRQAGVRLHVDTEAGKDQGYVTAGVFLSGGEMVGAGLGLRLGGGWKPNRNFRLGLVVDGVAGTAGAHGSVGVQAGWTF